MDDKKAEITCCNFSQTCSSPGARELHECRYGSSLIQFLLDYMHIRNALTPELDRSGIDKVDREVIRFFFEKVRKEAGKKFVHVRKRNVRKKPNRYTQLTIPAHVSFLMKRMNLKLQHLIFPFQRRKKNRPILIFHQNMSVKNVNRKCVRTIRIC